MKSRDVAMEEQAELLSECESASEASRSSTKRAFAIGFGVFALVGCLTAVTLTWNAQQGSDEVSARELLSSREFADAVTDNVMAMKGQSAGDRQSVRKAVGEEIREAVGNIQHHAPAVHSTLESSSLKTAEKHALLHSVRLLTDQRMLNINTALLNALQDTAADKLSADRGETMSHNIKEKMEPHTVALRQLRTELFPHELLGARQGLSWGEGVEPSRMRWVQALNSLKQEKATGARAPSARPTRRLSAHMSHFTKQAVKDHVSIFFDIMSLRDDAFSKFHVQLEALDSRRLQADEMWPYVVGCDTSVNSYEEPCTTTYSPGMACNPTCSGYESFYDCVMESNTQLSATAACFTDGLSTMYGSTFGAAWDTVKSTLGFAPDDEDPTAGAAAAAGAALPGGANSTAEDVPDAAGWR